MGKVVKIIELNRQIIKRDVINTSVMWYECSQFAPSMTKREKNTTNEYGQA